MIKPRRTKGKLNRYGRRRWRFRLLLVTLLLSVSGYFLYSLWTRGMLPANQPADEWYESTRQSKALVRIPADDAPHENQTEWWYHNGTLKAKDGQRYSFHIAVFLIKQLTTHTVLHASFLDHQSGKYYSTQQRTAGKPGEVVKDGFDFRFGQSRITGSNGQDELRVQTPEFSLQLNATSTTEAILHGETGLLDFKAAGTSYYYSRPRMTLTGTAGPARKVQPVTGEAWFDHQWGDFSVTSLGWNWFALQLDDGRDIMLFELFTPTGEKVVHFGTISQQAVIKTLDERDFSITATGQWQSPRTSIIYPMGWKIVIPSIDLTVELTPVKRDSEFDGRQSSYLIYWEGPITFKGSQTGKGFVEMSGYKAVRNK